MTELEAELAPPKLRARISVLAWSGLESTCRQILSLLFFFGTVRFLSPSDLGVFSLGVALMGIFAIVIDEPIGEALVQQHSATNSDWDTGYTINIAIALLCLLLACVASPILSNLLHQPLLLWVIPALAVSSLVGAVGNLHRAFLSRSLEFRRIAQTALLAQVIAGTVSLGVAAAGYGYWALVLNVLSAATATSITYRLFCAWRPMLRIDMDTVRVRAPYVGYSIAIRSLYLLRDQSLFVVVGTIGDLKTVGYLTLAMRVARALGQLFEEVTSRPLISLISRQQNDLTRFGDVLRTVLHIIGLIAFPSFIGLAELGTPVISVLIGAQWAPAGRFLPLICAGMSGWLFLHVIAVALRARDQGRLALHFTAPAIFADVAIFCSTAFIGLDWALKLWAVRALLTLPVLVSVLSIRLGVSVRSLAEIWAAPTTASVIMLISLRWLEQSPLSDQGAAGLLALIVVGAIIYGLALTVLTWRTTRNRLLPGTYRR
jgi:O-antigen/teichoic acid export membrane protein